MRNLQLWSIFTGKLDPLLDKRKRAGNLKKKEKRKKKQNFFILI